MREYSTDAIVLHKEPIGDIDSLIFLYTPDYGKIVARAKSARKITSKLSAQLEPAQIVSLRILRSAAYQIVDALSLQGALAWKTSFENLKALMEFLSFVNDISPEEQAERSMWDIVHAVLQSVPRSLRDDYVKVLACAGFDVTQGACAGCGKRPVDYYIPFESVFLCVSCRPRSRGVRVYTIPRS